MEDFLVTVLSTPTDMRGKHSREITPEIFYAPKFCCAQKNLFEI